MVRSKFAGLLRGILRRMDGDRDQTPSAPTERPVSAGAPAPVTSAAPSPSATSMPPGENEIALPLAPVVAGLPPELRAKIMSVPPPGLTINVPVETVLAQLPFGAVKISFGELRQLAASIFVNSGGEHDVKMVGLPLNEILPRLNPALLARRTGQKIEVGEEIKGPFGGKNAGVTFTTQPLKPASPPPPVPRADRPAVSVESPLPAAPIAFRLPPGMERTKPAEVPVPPPPEKKSADSNFYVWGDTDETPKSEENILRAAPPTDFTSRQAQPKEVVARALALPGVVGVLVTLPDGLLVASEVPATFNADTLAAFIPQLFERMNQSAKELRMGALNNVSFTVGNVPWRIYRVNSVYLAAFGRAGEALPAAELARLAGELDRKRNQ